MNQKIRQFVEATGYRERVFLLAWLCENLHLFHPSYDPKGDLVGIEANRFAVKVKVRWEGSDSRQTIDDFLQGKNGVT